jgi:ABC-2 type transport system permease protein
MSSWPTQDGIFAMSRREYPAHPLLELTIARLLEFLREPEAVFWVVVFPLALAFALGIAFRAKGNEAVYAGVVDSTGATQIRAALASSPDIHVRLVPRDRIDRALRDGDVQVVVLPGSPPTYRFDPTRPESALAQLAVDGALQRAAGRKDAFAAHEQRVQVVGSRYIDWLIPGLLGMNIMGTGMWSIGFSVVWARTRRVLKRLAATPMARRDYLLAQMLARLVFLVVEAGGLLGFAALVFSVPIRGSAAALVVVLLAGALAFGGLGLLVASRARTVEAASGWMNFSMLPMWVVSGVFFSSSHFPAATQPFIHALPLTALNDALRAVMLDGASLTAVSGEMAILAAWTGVSFAVALKIFRWT